MILVPPCTRAMQSYNHDFTLSHLYRLYTVVGRLFQDSFEATSVALLP